MLAELDRLASEPSSSETTLGEWLLKLDSGRWPLVVDRLAIRSMGWGPSSRINLAPLEATTLGPVKGVLQSIGLTATPLGGVVLISSRLETPERPADREAWATALREVPSGGSDSTDRFQSAGRWSGEATPRALAAGESPERSTGLVGWHSCRLVSSGWPGPRAFARLVSPRIEQAWGWLIASIILAGGILLRNQRPRVRGCVLVALGIATSVVLAWTWPEPPTWATGLIRGILGVTAFWVGSAFRKSPTPVTVSASEGSTTSRRSGFLAGVGGLVGLLGASVGQFPSATADNPKPEPPILALLVFDGTPDATSRPDRVILSLKDANRLRRLGEIDPTDPSSVVNLTAESHRVRREGPRTASVESRFEIDIQEKKGGAPARWTIPVGLARDLSSTVDGRPCPVRISADGQLAGIEFDGTGRRQVSFHRSLPISDFGAESERLLVPINRAAFATVVVENEPGKQVEIPSALGLLETGPGGIAGGLGPVDTLDVRWASDDRRRSPAINGPVEATLLWDARPVGDLIRVRLTHSDPDGSSTLRLALEPGLIVRGHSIPNVVSIRREGTVDRPEWVARIDPPWPKETPVEVDLWRAVAPGSIDRRWPSIGIGTVGKVNQLLGLRRSADWTGRFEPGQMAGVEAVAEPTFVKAWGPLDDPSMILAGAVRFSQVPAVGATIRPIALRRSILSNTRIDLVPGRMEVTIEATLKDLQGRSFNLDLGLPNELKLIKVEALGLVDWQRPTRDRLRLQFDGAAVTDRPIRIEGSLPVRLDPDRTETATYQAAIPWPRWADVEAVPGTLSVVGSTRFQVDPEAGVMELPPTSLATGETGFRTSYRVDRPTTLSTVRWSAQASRLGVSVQSDLRIESDSVDWTAVMVCDIAGEPIDHLNWNLPTEWARNATLEIEGHSHRIEAEIKGETSLWTIRPDSRLWGRVKLILRSKRAIGPARRLAFPDLAPLATPGRGSVERYLLAIANVSGRELVLEGLKGLQPIDLARTTLDDSLGMSGLVDHAFQVKGGRWSLGLSIGPASPQNAIAGESGASKIRLATICAVVGEAGEVWGLARYELQDRTGPFLRLQVPDSVEIPWSMVDGLVQPVIREGPGRRLVPLGDREARRVSVLWHRRRSPTDDRSLDRLALPEPVSSHPPTFVTIAAPPSVLVAPEGRAFEKIGLNIGNSESAQWMAGGIIDRLENLDPLAPEARERLLEDLIELELRARTNERQRVTQQSASDLPQIRTALASIQEAAENFGLADLIVEAQARVGLVRGLADPTASHTTSLVDLVRLRRVGVRSDYRTAKDGSADPLAFTIRRNESEPVPNRSEHWRILGIGLVVSLVLGRWVAWPWTSTQRTLKVLTWVGLALIFVWEPLGMAGLLALAGLGRKVG